jgi:SAM-dependent methyltransferase
MCVSNNNSSEMGVLKYLRHYLPNAEFTRRIEEFFEKENPEKVIAWPDFPVPDWANGFRPKVFLDLGCGLGGQTCATLIRLAQWGCLENLERVVLVDRDPDLHAGGSGGLKEFLETRVREILSGLGFTNIEINAFVREFYVSEKSEEIPVQIALLNEICPVAGIILISHVTYFFGDGSGQSLVEALAPHLSPNGRLWVNVRDQECPAYSKRREVFELLNIKEEQPFDYSEYFYLNVIPRLKNYKLLDKQSVSVDIRPGSDRFCAARLAMWRTDIGSDAPEVQPLLAAALEVCNQGGPIYSETQFLLAHK